MLDVKADTSVVYPSITAVRSLNKKVRIGAYQEAPSKLTHFFFIGQFWACNGSSGPVNSTTYSSCAGRSGGYGFPRPISGRGLLLSRLLPVRLRPMVPACCDLAVCIRLITVGCLSKSLCVDIRRMTASLRATEPSEDSVEVLDAVWMRSISWLGRTPENLSGEASRSFLTISRSASFILAIVEGNVRSEEIELNRQLEK